ncbi:NOL1/NOP2/Sun domain member 3 [Nowakowskiella sp. JEL0078]|nr:NOL1/NOP2/Sun domain member 3 [Nowakowskiella sp. JEL0078]
MKKLQQRNEAAKAAFDKFYKDLYGERWESLCRALEQPTRYCCVLNKHASPVHLSILLAPLASALMQLPFTSCPCLIIPQDPSVLLPWPSPSLDEFGRAPYYLMDAASVLVVSAALKPSPKDSILDLCSAPGGKSFVILQSLEKGGFLQSNDSSSERVKRLKNVVKECLPPMTNGVNNRPDVFVSCLDATEPKNFDEERFDKVLVDAPCSTDRHILHDIDQLQKWSASRLRTDSSRQFSLLMTAIRAVRVGGIIVYATCSLASIENDGVISKFLSRISSPTTPFCAEVVHLETEPVIGERTEHGWLVLPDKTTWGPLYFSIIKRLQDKPYFE